MAAPDRTTTSEFTPQLPTPLLEALEAEQVKRDASSRSRSLGEQIAVLDDVVAGALPSEVAARFDAEQRDLDAHGPPPGVLAPGSPMPDGQLLDPHGATTSLTEARAGHPVVVVFYRGDWCPYCNLQLRTYQNQLVPTLAERGIELVAISPQKPDGSLSLQELHHLTFTVLSDPGHQIAGQLGILTSPDDGARQSHAELGLDVPGNNADGTYTLAMPTVAIADADGVLRWIDVHLNYTTRTEPTDILAALAELGL